MDIGNWELKREEVKMESKAVLGKGAFGSVVKGTLRGKTVAVKILSVDMSNKSARVQMLQEDLRRECACMWYLISMQQCIIQQR